VIRCINGLPSTLYDHRVCDLRYCTLQHIKNHRVRAAQKTVIIVHCHRRCRRSRREYQITGADQLPPRVTYFSRDAIPAAGDVSTSDHSWAAAVNRNLLTFGSQKTQTDCSWADGEPVGDRCPITRPPAFKNLPRREFTGRIPTLPAPDVMHAFLCTFSCVFVMNAFCGQLMRFRRTACTPHKVYFPRRLVSRRGRGLLRAQRQNYMPTIILVSNWCFVLAHAILHK